MKNEEKSTERFMNELPEIDRRIPELERSENEHRMTIEILQASENKHRELLENLPQKYFIKIKTLFMYPATTTMLVI